MKKLLVSLALALSSMSAMAVSTLWVSPVTVFSTGADEPNSRLMYFADDGAPCVWMTSGSASNMSCPTLGANLSLSGGVLSATSTPGATGASGKSAYQLAVDGGYSGTVSAWLASLQGATGPAGAASTVPGPKGDTGANGTNGTNDLLTLTTIGSGAATYNAGAGALNIPTPTLTSGTVTGVTAGSGLSGGTITTTGTISMPNVGMSGSYSGVTTDAQGRVTAGTNRSKTSVTKAVGTCFQLSSTRDAWVTYNVEIQSASNLVGGQRGTLYLETFTDSGCTAGTEEVMRSTSGNTMGLGVSLGNTIFQTLNVNGYIMSGLWAKLRTANDVSTPTFTARPGQEVLQ